jgi:hypothetical protein
LEGETAHSAGAILLVLGYNRGASHLKQGESIFDLTGSQGGFDSNSNTTITVTKP